eukprot:g17608.t1
MIRKKAFHYVNSLQKNISLYFPFLVYYQISYYKSPLFDITSIGGWLQRGFPAELEEVFGDSLASARLTLRALVSTALIAADPNELSPSSSWLIADSPADDWLSLDWQKEATCAVHRAFCWPVFGALALLRDTAWHPAGFCEASTSFSNALYNAVQTNEAVPLKQSLDFLHEPPRSCGEQDARVLRAAATLAVADWARRTAKRGVQSVEEEVQDAVATAYALVSEVLEGEGGGPSFLGLQALSMLPGGSELLWILDRLQCAPVVSMTAQAHEFWKGAENVGMKNDVEINYKLSIFPYRELVSDFVRARQVPYCNESILQLVQALARRLDHSNARSVQVIEIGANLGDCALWIARRMQAVPGLRRIKVIALEAVPAAARRFEESVQLNNLSGIIQVVNVAAGQVSGSVSLRAKPMSSNSYTLVNDEGSATDSATVPTRALDDLLDGSSQVDLLISHTNGQELSVLRGATRLLRHSRRLVVLLQLYGPQSGVIRDPKYDASRPVRWLANRGFRIWLSQRKGLRLETPGVLQRHFKEGEQVVNVIAIRKHQRHLLSAPPPRRVAQRTCLDLARGERPNSWAEVDGRVLRENLHVVRIYLERHFGVAPPIGAVLKANAYGHGAVLAGRVLASARIDALFVSEIETGPGPWGTDSRRRSVPVLVRLMLRMAPEVPTSLPVILLYRSPDEITTCKLANATPTPVIEGTNVLH